MLKKLYKWLFKSCDHNWKFEYRIRYNFTKINYHYPSALSQIEEVKETYICTKCLKQKEITKIC